jgi:hypothetical protein
VKPARAGGLPARAAFGAALLMLSSACAWFRAPEPPPPPVAAYTPSEYEVALAVLRLGNVADAESLLRQVASSCESGQEGRSSLLLLSSLWLDGLPQATPDSAAVLAARVLALPDAGPLELSVARNIYLFALELGADAKLRPARFAGPRDLAVRFSDCDQPTPAVDPAPLPQLGREPLTATVRRLEAQRDSLAHHADRSGERAVELAGRIQELEGQLRGAQAEIERIRRLLGGRDTTTVRPRPF